MYIRKKVACYSFSMILHFFHALRMHATDFAILHSQSAKQSVDISLSPAALKTPSQIRRNTTGFRSCT